MRSSASRIDILLTHLHVDHVEGLGLFAPIWASETELHIWGRRRPSRAWTNDSPPTSRRRCSPCTCPRCPLGCRSTMRRGALDDRIGAAHVSPDPASRAHRGLPVGARRRTLAYVTDHEPGLGTDLLEVGTEWISGFALAYRADLLVHDCQYTDEEYRDHVGWGHASVSHVAAFARRAEVDRLVLFHHHPDRDDDGLDAMRESMLDAWPVAVDRCIVAAEGADVEV